MREGDGWYVFLLQDGRAVRRRVDIGHIGSGVAEVRTGLRAGERVVIFPPDALRDGARARAKH